MPALPPTTERVIRFDLQWAIEGDPMGITRLYWQYTGGPPSASHLQTICQAVGGEVDVNLKSLMGSWVQLTEVKATVVGPVIGPQGFFSFALVGTRAGNRLAPGTATLVNYPIPRLYRGGKPRSYFPFGVDTDVATTGLWADAFVADVDNGITAFQAGMATVAAGTTNLTEQANVSYYDGVNPPTTLPSGRVKQSSKLRAVPVVDTVDGEATSKIIGSQRRRNRNA